MNREWLSKAFGDMDERYVLEAYRPVPENVSGASEKIVHKKKKRIITVALTAALTLVLGIAAYAAWSIHEARQQELRAALKIDENNVSSYVEYEVSDEETGGLVLLSAVNDGQTQRIYVNISPVSEEEADDWNLTDPFPVFTVNIDGTSFGGNAQPYAYDAETQTLTLECFLAVSNIKSASALLGTDTIPISVQMITGIDVSRSFDPMSFTMTGEQLREFDFGNVLYHDPELDQDVELVGLDLTPFGIVWKIHYEGDAEMQALKFEDFQTYKPWCELEERVIREIKIILSDGTELSFGGSLNSHYENGAVHLWYCWKLSAVDINDVQRIVIGDQILWDAEAESAG